MLIRVKASHYIFKNVRQSYQIRYLIRHTLKTSPTTRMNIYIVSPILESIHITRPYLEYEIVGFYHLPHPLMQDLDEIKDGSFRIYQYLGGDRAGDGSGAVWVYRIRITRAVLDPERK